VSFEDDPCGFDFSWDRERFTDRIWPTLRSSFLPLTPSGGQGWAGLYAVNTLDSKPSSASGLNLMVFTSQRFFRSRLQQSPAVGRYSPNDSRHQPALDLSILHPRILENKPLSEGELYDSTLRVKQGNGVGSA